MIYDPATQEVRIGAQRPALTATERSILEMLMRRSPAVVDRRSIAQNVWENDADALGPTRSTCTWRGCGPSSPPASCASSRCAPSDTGYRAGELAPPRPRVSLPASGRHAARVALAATLLVGVVYAAWPSWTGRSQRGWWPQSIPGCASAWLDRDGSSRPGRARRARASSGPAAPRQARARRAAAGAGGGPQADPDDDDDVDEAPCPVAGPARARPGRPDRGRARAAGGRPRRRRAGHVRGRDTFRLVQVRQGGSWLVAGQSLAEQQHTMNVLRGGEALVGPVLLLAMFAGSLIIGLRALSPVEQSRRRQLGVHRGCLARAPVPR